MKSWFRIMPAFALVKAERSSRATPRIARFSFLALAVTLLFVVSMHSFAEEKPALLPLPIEPFRYYNYGERTVHLDSCVEVEAASASWASQWPLLNRGNPARIETFASINDFRRARACPKQPSRSG